MCEKTAVYMGRIAGISVGEKDQYAFCLDCTKTPTKGWLRQFFSYGPAQSVTCEVPVGAVVKYEEAGY